MDWPSVSGSSTGEGPKGLKNLGNTCYLNATLQCILCTAPLSHYLTSSNHVYKCMYEFILFINIIDFTLAQQVIRKFRPMQLVVLFIQTFVCGIKMVHGMVLNIKNYTCSH
jgi:ubiquitin C-terminal hydrolase